MSRAHLDPDNGDTSHEEVACPVCAGTGYVVENDGARDWCDECGMSGLVSQQHAENLARERASNFSYPRE